ncbi:PREDICTED: probable polygalacturonase At1g80170 [Fragaria vesca subsp. vesca]|uniref:probable polygalacturonase At1g80170 n=1 Tax=Fragaria vesca subsp. vesca TaxID=101020 RepID=UPI0002C306C9|nr:PREDICTED: probable polygalacturonase At1g80170 [Fragaria vesca subsp. vesca]
MKSLRLYSSSSSTCLILLLLIFSFSVSSNTTVDREKFDSLLQLPHSGSTRTRLRSKRVLFLGAFGAKGDGITDDSKAFQNAWEVACSIPTRTRILIPSGRTYLIHPVDIAGPCRSKVTLMISGTIIAPISPDAWIGLNARKWIYFHGVNHLTVEGGGTVDGMGQEWWARSCKSNSTNPCRHAPTAITFHRCKNLKVRNLMIVNSQKMHMQFTNCMRVVASHLQVIAPATSPNTDGIHISVSKGVQVKDSIIRTGDDCISIVSNSSRIQIVNIVCGPGHGISIGSLGKSNSWSQVRDVIIDTALLSNTENGVRIKTWQGGSGFASNIAFRNVVMDNVSNPIIIDQYYCDSQLPCLNQTLAVKVENISFTHIKGTSATEEAIRFACSDDSQCEGLYLEDVQLLPSTGEIARSFCWEAQGSSLGTVDPPACFSDSEELVKQKVLLHPVSLVYGGKATL